MAVYTVYDTAVRWTDSLFDTGGAILTDMWCRANYGNDPVMLARCKGGRRMDSVLFPNPPMPATVPPPPLTSSGNSAIPYDRITDYLIGQQNRNQRIQTQEFFDTTASNAESIAVSDSVNWWAIGGVTIAALVLIKKL
jgi:hypothetical protein